MKIFFKSKIAIYLCPSYRRRLQPSKENIQHFQKMKFINFFQCLWVIFALQDPDTDQGTPLNPDPQHCLNKTTRNLNNLTSAATKPRILYKQKIIY
jgi:hypothetical protein